MIIQSKRANRTYNGQFGVTIYNNWKNHEYYRTEIDNNDKIVNNSINENVYENINQENKKSKINLKENYNLAHFFYTWGVFLSLVVVSIIAQANFSTRFNIFTNTVSEQGSILLNPVGGSIWRIGVIINGITHIPHNIFVHKKISSINPLLSTISAISSIIAAIAFSFVGAIPVDYGFFHYFAATFAFVGYYISGILDFIIIRSKNSPLSDFMKSSKIILFSIIYFLVSGAGCLFSFMLSGNSELFAMLFPILEWNYLLVICIWILSWSYLFHKFNE